MDIRARLQAHLGDAFQVERELGGGGMSRVFVATEVRLNRRVAIKVLTPELAQGLNAERFEREILLAASLQQANIVPLLSAGDFDGLPYFTMPFIEGESLRQRAGGRQMPIAQVVAVLRDVARALEYAHARGIVHRDIKPDNVLLSGATAVVTDFGIAKALSASRGEAPGATLTSVGTSIGTPSYMAPEQVAGDPKIDHRVDLYALGCLAFELLAGEPPFGTRTPQKILAAHLGEAPRPIETVRTDCPPALALLVAQMLEKDPVDRIDSASEVLRALDDVGASTSVPSAILQGPGMLGRVLALYAVAIVAIAILAKAAVVGIGLPEWVVPGAVGVMLLGLPVILFTGYVKQVTRKAAVASPTLTPGGTMTARPLGTMATMALRASPHVSWRKAMRIKVALMSTFVVLVAAFLVTRSLGIGPAGSLFAAGSLNAQDRLLLADFTAPADEADLAPIVVEAVRAAMTQSTAVKVLDQGEVAEVLGQMRQPAATPIEGAVAQEVAERAAAKAILRGRLARAGNGFAVSLELVSTAGGATLTSVQGSAGDASELISVVDELTRKLRSKIGESLRDVARTVPLEEATTTNLEALRKYTEATRANDIDQDFDRAVTAAREAVALDSTFALAWRKLAVALGNTRASNMARDSALERAARHADKLPEKERLMVMGGLYDNHSVLGDRDKALATYQQLYRLDSSSVIAANQLTRLHGFREEYDSAVRYTRRQIEVEPVFSTRTRLIVPLLEKGDLTGAAAVFDSLRRGDYTGSAPFGVYRSAILLNYARGDWAAARAMADTLAALPGTTAQIDGLMFAASLEYVAGRLSRARALELRRGSLDRARGLNTFDSLAIAGTAVWFLDRRAEGVALVDRIVQSPAWTATPAVDRPYIEAAAIYTAGGRPDRARQLLAEYRSAVPGIENVALSRALIAQREGEILLAEGKPAEAIERFRSTMRGPGGTPPSCRLCAAIGLSQAYAEVGPADSAIAWMERYMAAPAAHRALFSQDARYLARFRKRLGELYDAKGERVKAIAQYQAFVEQWADADPELQPTVASVRRRLEELKRLEG